MGALGDKHILIVCGSGGVGKTTTAAALGLHAARLGRRVLVCTIDPSRRLATSLGLARLPEKPKAIDLRKLGVEEGTLSAMVVDTKRTFDALVEMHASAESRQRILENRFYKQVSSALAGSHEYMAMEKLLELSGDDRFDLIVLDTPPTRHALDFLEAPDRLRGFLDTSVLRWFVKPYFAAGRLTLKVATKTGAIFMMLADRVLGLQFLQDLSEFFLAFEDMYDGFKERAARVHDLLRSEGSGFVLVASPAPQTLDEALWFHRRLREKEMPFVSFVVNRVHPDPGQGMPRGAAEPEVEIDEDLVERLVEIFQDQKTLARMERRTISRLEDATGDAVILVPEFESDVHDLRGLRDVADAMFEPPSARPAETRRPRAARSVERR